MPKHVTETTGASVEAAWDFEATSVVRFRTGATLEIDDTLAVSEGGTGADTAAGARTSLGVAESGANSTITSLTGLTTPLSISQGGTDAGTSPAARTALGAAVVGANDDITSLEALTLTQYGVVYRGATNLTASAAATSPYQELTSGSNGEPSWRDKIENIVFVVSAPDSNPTEVSKAAQFYLPFRGFVKEAHAGVSTPSSTMDVIVDVDMAGTSIFSTKLYIDAGETTSATAATACVIGAGTSGFAQWGRCDIHVDKCGTTAEGLVVTLVCVRTD